MRGVDRKVEVECPVMSSVCLMVVWLVVWCGYGIQSTMAELRSSLRVSRETEVWQYLVLTPRMLLLSVVHGATAGPERQSELRSGSVS